MKYNTLNEAEIPTIAIIHGRFNPPHAGHKGAWESAQAAGVDGWYVGTHANAKRDTKKQQEQNPLPYEIKAEAMLKLMPELQGHLVPEQSWITLAKFVYDKHGKVNLLLVCDSDDAKTYLPLIQRYNGVEGHYNFANIDWAQAKRAGSGTNQRQAVIDGDRDAFYRGLGVPEFKVQGKDFFDLVSHYLLGTEMKESSLGKIVREGYFSQSVDKVAKDWNERKRTGKWPDETGEKNPLSHDKDGVHVSDKDLAGRQIITYLNDKGKKVTGSVAKRSTNSPKGYFLDTGEFVSQRRVISKESTDEINEDQNLDIESIVNAVKKESDFRTIQKDPIKLIRRVQYVMNQQGYSHLRNQPTLVDKIVTAIKGESLGESDPMNPTVGNYDLDTLQRKVARDFAEMAETAANAKSRREWNNIMHQLSNNTMYQLEDILDTYETLQDRYSKGGANSRGIDKSRLESTSTLMQNESLFTDDERKQNDINYLKKRLADFERMDDPDASDIRIALDHKKRLDKLTRTDEENTIESTSTLGRITQEGFGNKKK